MHRIKIKPRKKYMKGFPSCLFWVESVVVYRLVKVFLLVAPAPKNQLTRTRPGKFFRSRKCSVESKKDTKCYLFNIVVAFQTEKTVANQQLCTPYLLQLFHPVQVMDMI